MIKFALNLIEEFNLKLNLIETEEPIIMNRAEKALFVIHKYLPLIKDTIQKHTFNNAEDEIHYFKITQPQIFAKLFYYNEINSIESKRPFNAASEKVTQYLEKRSKKYYNFFKDNQFHYHYYKSNVTELDDKYFVRLGKMPIIADDCFFFTDPKSTTGYDILFARLIAYEKLCEYLKSEIQQVEYVTRPPEMNVITSVGNRPKWTASKADLVELIYSISASKSINNGKIDLRELKNVFEIVFNIDLKDIYKIYSEIKFRSDRTKFIDYLKTSLNSKMAEEDN